MLNGTPQKQTLVAILALAALLPAGAAEMPAPVAESPAAPPTIEQQAFEDWHLACPDDGCLIFTRIVATDGTEVLRVEVGGTPARLRFATPLGLHLPDGLVAGIGPELTRRLAWRTCAPDTGCLADTALDPELLAALRRERTGTALLTLADGVAVRLGISLMGFSTAARAIESGTGVTAGPAAGP